MTKIRDEERRTFAWKNCISSNTDSDESEEFASISNIDHTISPALRACSPWTTDEPSDLRVHADNTESLRLVNITDKVAIRHPTAPELPLVCSKEEPPRRDSSIAGSEGIVSKQSQTLPTFMFGCRIFARDFFTGYRQTPCRSRRATVCDARRNPI